MTTKTDLSTLHNERQQTMIERSTIKRQIDRVSQSIAETSRLHGHYVDRLRVIDQRIDQIEHQITQIEHARTTSTWQRIKTMIVKR